LTAAIETLQDVTEQKNVEAALERSEAKFRTIIDTQPECVKLVGADGIILEINKAGLSMLDADSQGEIAGQSMMKFVVPEHVPAVQIHFEGILNGESSPVEFEIRAPRCFGTSGAKSRQCLSSPGMLPAANCPSASCKSSSSSCRH
jgi:PAS domain S-box-containing protein